MTRTIRAFSKQIALAALLGISLTCNAADLSILSAGATKSALGEIVESYQKFSNDKINVEYLPVGVIMNRLANGAAPDILLVTADVISDVENKGWAMAVTAAAFGSVGVGVAVQEQAKSPDISTPEALKQTLLNARSITYIDPNKGTSGKHFAEVLKRMGIAEQMKAKTILGDTGYVVEPVARGEVEIGIQQITEILPVKGVKLAGPLPASLQKITVYTVALGAHSTESEAAKKFITYLSGADARDVIKKKGFSLP